MAQPAISTVNYTYDAFGNLLHSTGTTFNEFLFAGEQFDSDLGLYYNRARYLNVSTGRFLSMDIHGSDIQSPISLHRYLYASADPVDRVDPSGNEDLNSIMTGISIGMTIATMSNVVVAGVISAAYGSYPDAVAIGVFGAVSFGPVGGIGGYEVVFDPRLKEAATFIFGGFEPSISVPLSPNVLKDNHSKFHKEAGGFVAWYWNLKDLNPGNFGLVGISGAGGFFAYETTPEGALAVLNGVTTDQDLSLFGIFGGEVRLSDQQSVSEGAMITDVALGEAALSALAIATSKGPINPGAGAAAAAFNAGLGALWVHYTYGKAR